MKNPGSSFWNVNVGSVVINGNVTLPLVLTAKP